MNNSDQSAMAPQKNNLWKQVLAFVFAIVLLWLAFRGTDFATVWGYAKTANPIFLVLTLLSAIISHLLRAIRWVYMLEPVAGRKVTLFNSFSAVIIGYAVNVAIPRGGEVARLISISRSEQIPWAGVLPTMFIDRMLDIAMLGLLLGMTLSSLPKEIIEKFPLLVPGGAGLAVASVLGLLVLPWVGDLIRKIIAIPHISTKAPSHLLEKIEQLAEQFAAGTKSMTNPKTLPIIALLTPLIWFFYWLNYYLVAYAFNLQSMVSPLQCLIVFTVGSVGVLVPTPGSVGSTHFLISHGLMATSGVNQELALAYASVCHLCCFIVAVCIPAAICVALQARAAKTSKQTAQSS